MSASAVTHTESEFRQGLRQILNANGITRESLLDLAGLLAPMPTTDCEASSAPTAERHKHGGRRPAPTGD